MRLSHSLGLMVMFLVESGVAHAQPPAPPPMQAAPHVKAPASAPAGAHVNVNAAPAGKLQLPPAQHTQLEGAFKGVSHAQLHAIAKGDHVAMAEADFDAARPDDKAATKRIWARGKEDMRLQLLMSRPPNRAAILEIGRRGDPESVPLLSKIALGEVHVQENHGVVVQMASFSRTAINSPADAAVVALGLAGGDEAVSTLEKVLLAGKSSLYLTLDALGAIGGPKAMAVLRSAALRNDHFSPVVLGKLCAMGDEAALSRLARTFNEGKGMDRETSFVELTGLGVPFLTTALRNSRDPDVRLAAIRTLGGMTVGNGVRTDVSQFKTDLQWAGRNDPSMLNRSRAIKFVGNLYGKGAIVEMFADAPDQKRVGELAGTVTSPDRNRRDVAINELALLDAHRK